MRITKSMILASAGNWLLLGLALVGLTAFAAAQSEAPAPPPPPHDMNVMFGGGPGMGVMMGMAHAGMEEGKLVKGVPMSGEMVVTRGQPLPYEISTTPRTQPTIYRASEGRVRRESGVGFWGGILFPSASVCSRVT